MTIAKGKALLAEIKGLLAADKEFLKPLVQAVQGANGRSCAPSTTSSNWPKRHDQDQPPRQPGYACLPEPLLGDYARAGARSRAEFW